MTQFTAKFYFVSENNFWPKNWSCYSYCFIL